MRMWQGLGYYSRARNLHAAAQQILAMGEFPKTYDAIRKLKGVGDYTAAAIASFAYDEPKAAVDGNVCRVWSRVFGIDTPIDSVQGKRMITDIAQSLLPMTLAAKYNQAVMEFGALQCTPHSPNCTECPLQEKCAAFAECKVDTLPTKSHKTKVTPRYLNYLYIHTTNHLLLHKRLGNDIWQNMYELPLIETEAPIDADSLFLHPTFRIWQEAMPVCIYKGASKEVKHVLSHRVLHAIFYEFEVSSTLPCIDDNVPVSYADLDTHALPRLIDRYLTEKVGNETTV